MDEVDQFITFLGIVGYECQRFLIITLQYGKVMIKNIKLLKSYSIKFFRKFDF